MSVGGKWRVIGWAALFSCCSLDLTAARAAETAAKSAWAVTVTDIDDLKAVYATIRSKDRVEARVRTPGTIASLSVSEGMHVSAGQLLGVVVDDKIALRMRALDAQIDGLKSTEQKAEVDLDRALSLKKQNLVAQSNVDQLASAHDVAANALKSAAADRAVLETQMEEGQVKAPANGRLLSVPVTVGSVMMAGESVASIAANDYLLRLELPERHARFIKNGDPISIGSRGLGLAGEIAGSGHITLVHPELQAGQVIADAEATGLGDYFVGERTMVWISVGKRRTIVIPRSLVTKRGGYDFVALVQTQGPALDIVVQLGRQIEESGKAAQVEVLSGLEAGDQLVQP